MDIYISIIFCYNNNLFSFDGLLLLERGDDLLYISASVNLTLVVIGIAICRV